MNSQQFDNHIKSNSASTLPRWIPPWEQIAARTKRKPVGFWYSLLHNRGRLTLIALLLLTGTGAGSWWFYNNSRDREQIAAGIRQYTTRPIGRTAPATDRRKRRKPIPLLPNQSRQNNKYSPKTTISVKSFLVRPIATTLRWQPTNRFPPKDQYQCSKPAGRCIRRK